MEVQQALYWSGYARLLENFQQFSRTRKAERVRSIRRKRWRLDVPVNDSRQHIVKRISIRKVPHGQSQFPPRLQHSQNLADSVAWRREKHHPEAADRRVKRVSRKRQLVGKRDVKLHVPYIQLACRSSSGCNHLRDRIDPMHFAFRSNQFRHA